MKNDQPWVGLLALGLIVLGFWGVVQIDGAEGGHKMERLCSGIFVAIAISMMKPEDKRPVPGN